MNPILCRYNHKLMKLAEAVLQEVVDFKVEEDRFQVGLMPSLTISWVKRTVVQTAGVRVGLDRAQMDAA